MEHLKMMLLTIYYREKTKSADSNRSGFLNPINHHKFEACIIIIHEMSRLPQNY